jgi:hypothetical protein
MFIPSPPERLQIAAKALIPPRGVLKAYRTPERCRASTLERLRRAAVELGFPAPAFPPPQEPRP